MVQLAQNYDRKLLLDPGLVRESVALRRAIEKGADVDPVLMQGIGWLHWGRFQLLPEGDDQQDLTLALWYFQQVRYVAPNLEMPEPVRRALDGRAIGPAVGGSPERWNTKAGEFVERFNRTGDPVHLDNAVALLQQTLAAVPGDYPGRPIYLANLSSTLQKRYEATGAAADLDDAISLSHQALGLTSEADPERPGRLSRLASALHLRFDRRGTLADLDEALHLHRLAATTVSGNHPDRAAILSGLANALQMSYQHSGELATLDEAIRLHEQIAELTPHDNPNWAGYLSNLAAALEQRHEATGDASDADRVITLLEQGLQAVPAGHPLRQGLLTNLAFVLQNRHRRGRQADTLDEAIRAGTEAVQLLPPGHPETATGLSSLGLALHARFLQTQDRADREAALNALEQAVVLTPVEHRDYPGFLANLATTLFQGRHSLLDDLGELDQAVLLFRRAIDRRTEDDPQRAAWLNNLSLALKTRYDLELQSDAADLDAAVEAAQEAALTRVAAPTVRAHAAWNAGKWLAQSGAVEPAAQAYRLAVELLPRLASRRLAQTDQEYQLGSMAGLAGQAAACVLSSGDPQAAARAFELLEYGRGILLGQALDLRGDVTALQAAHTELAEQFVRLRQAFDEPPAAPGPAGRGSVDLDRRQLADEWDRLTGEIRNQPGFEDWLKPPRIAELTASAASGPVIAINVSELRCDALVLTRDGVDVIPLPKLSLSTANETAASFLDALETTHDPMTDPLDRQAAEKTIVDLLGRLWDMIAQPVLSALGLDHTPQGDWPRVWWCPTSALSFLPLHAAGHHGSPASPRQPANAVIDCVISSYTPTVRALHHARARSAQNKPLAAKARRRLVVTLPDTPGQQSLQAARREAEYLAARYPDAKVLTGEEATFERVQAELRQSAWAHFACHGSSDMDVPSSGHLSLYDRELTVLDVSRLNLEHAEFAYLSACTTARSSQRLADEPIHIAAAFQLAGYPHVVGTLWPIADELAPHIARHLYETVSEDLSNAAARLHSALRMTRDRYHLGMTPSLWAAFIHAGP
ncbi:MAG TPA: CHAT domain-containing protein [Streptosporangiaceae bacterium]|nr:CHAT domain-containing protein [Streptosporangiaceae bacterium]